MIFSNRDPVAKSHARLAAANALRSRCEVSLMIGPVMTLMTATFSCAAPALAQRVEPAAVKRFVSETRAPRLSNEITRSPYQDMKKGSKYGAITGAILSGITVIAIRSSGCSTAEAPCTRLGNGQSVAIVGAGAAGGALIGAILGYARHAGIADRPLNHSSIEHERMEPGSLKARPKGIREAGRQARCVCRIRESVD
jgi:hypothetical protein